MLALKKRLSGLPNGHESFTILKAIEALFDTQALGSAGLTFTTTTWQTANTVPYLIGKQLYTKAAVTTQAVPTAIAWTGVASTYNAGGFLIAYDAAGNVTTYATPVVSTTASAAAALANLQWPAVPDNVCVIGSIVIYTSTANTTFTPATTALNAAGITTLFNNTVGPFFPVPAI